MNDTDVKGAGWWLPEPRSRFDAPASPERTARFRFFGSFAIKAWLAMCVAFGGLLWADPHINAGQRVFGTLMFTGATGLVFAVLMALAWCVQ